MSALRSKNFKVPADKLEDVNRIIKSIMDNNDLIKLSGDALVKALEYYDSGGVLPDALDEQKIEDVLYKVKIELGCEFISYDSLSRSKFQCSDEIDKTKQFKQLSPRPEITILKCINCQKNKELKRQKEFEKKLEKENIKKVIRFRTILIDFLSEGIKVDAYFCTGDAHKHQSLIFSRDNMTLPCPLDNMMLVEIERVCMKTINPETKVPPCKHFLEDQHKAKIKKNDFTEIEAEYEEVIESLPQLEHRESIEAESKEVQDDVPE